LARITGLSRQAIYALEEGRSEGNLETWIKLANAMDTPVEELSGRAFEGLNEYAGKA